MATSVGQKFEVFASKTEADAKALSSSHPGALCFTTDKHSIVFNGVVYSLTEIVNVLTDSSTDKALSAAQGKALKALIDALPTTSQMNSAINAAVGSVYKVKGTKTNISEVVALTDAKVGDVWNVTNEFTLSSKKYPAGTNVVCTTATSSSDHDEGNWDALGGTVDLSQYLTIANAVSTYLKKTDAESTYLKKADVVNNLTTSTTGKALDASQGKVLNDKITNLTNATKKIVYVLPGNFNLSEETLSDKSAVEKILGTYDAFMTALQIKGAIYAGQCFDNDDTTYSCDFTVKINYEGQYISLISVLDSGKLFFARINYDEGSNNWTNANYGVINILSSSSIVNNLTTSTTGKVLDASQGKVLSDKINTKQETLKSGTNIKTVNGQSVLGSGNIDVSIIIQ